MGNVNNVNPENTMMDTKVGNSTAAIDSETTVPLKKKANTPWKDRQDFWAFLFGIIFMGILIGMIFACGNARGWDAQSGFTHNETSSVWRFLPEPYIQEPGVRGRHGEDATGRWYYWKVPPSQTTVWTHFFPWICYAGHQILIWGSIYFAQCAKAMEPLGKGRYTTDMRMFNWFALVANGFFHLLHFINTHATYDGLAQDTSISSSQGSVILLLVLVVIMEYSDRGLFFGWPTRARSRKLCSTRAVMPYGPVYLVKKYHGYAFSWAAIFTFWYHPMENTAGHVLGFLHTWTILLQGSLMFTDFHLNRYWRLFNEIWVILHGGVVAAQTGGPAQMGTRLWPMFVFGFALVFVMTQIFTLPFWSKAPMGVHVVPLVVYLILTLWCYSWIPEADGQTWVRIQEIIRIPAVYYLYFIIGFGIMLGFLAAEKKLKTNTNDVASTPGKRAGYLIGALLVYALMVGISILVEYVDVKMNLIILMIIFVGIFMIGAAVSFMLLKQAIPQKWPKSEQTNGSAQNIYPVEDKLSQPDEKKGQQGFSNGAYHDHL